MSSAATIDSDSRKTLQEERDSQTTNLSESRTDSTPDVTISGITYRYSNVVIPTSGYHVLTVNYYDNYNYPNAPTIPTSIEGQDVYYNTTKKPIGLLTGSWIRAIKTSTSYRNETTYVLYDYKARPIRTFIKNHENSPGGYTQIDSKLDFSGKTLYTLTLHKRINSETGITIKDSFTYTDQDRLKTHTQQIGTGAVQLLAENNYDELGQLISKNVGNTVSNPLQKVDYSYNIRGWLTGINNDPTNNLVLNTNEKDLFAFKINYNTTEGNVTSVKSLYNGNISETYYRTGSDNVLRKYGYEYDNLNRLKNAIYQKPGGNTYPAYEDYSEKNITYDRNGNIQKLYRNGDLENALPANQIDDLHYTYRANSNILTNVYDNSGNTSGFKDGNTVGDDYTYDANGNMTTDKNKNITEIIYNHLNLPTKITFGTTGTIEYLYDANGKKLEKLVTQGTVVTTTKYLEGFQYTNDVLSYFPTAEGYVSKTGSSYKYVFNYTDHLGNIRLSYAKNPITGLLEILEENNYYPFGLKHSPSAVVNLQPNYKYKYNGKELQDELGLNVYDYGGRIYAPDAPRFWQIDPKTEKYYNISPYVYVADNPVNAIDPTGEEIIFIVRGQNGAKDQTLNYSKGNFYHSDGKRYNPGKESLSPTLYKVLSAYRQIEKSNNNKLKTVLHQLEKSKLKHYVEDGAKEGQSNHVEIYGLPVGSNKDAPIGTRTYYNFSEEENKDFEETEGVPNSVEATVAHEMRHQYDYDIGNMGDDRSPNDENDPSEIRAVFFENLMRRTLKQLKRREYGEPIDSEKLKDPPNNIFR